MATFIDDQGGTAWTPGSHTHFRLAAAWLPTAHVGPFKQAVQALRKELGRRANYEFKFIKTHRNPEIRTRFYHLALDHGLRFTACAFDKTRIDMGAVETPVFYQVCAVTLAAHLRATYLEAERARCVAEGRFVLLHEPIIVDDNKDRAMLSAIEDGFRALVSGRDPEAILTNKPVFRDSAKDETVQLADMVIGAIGAHLDGGDSSWYHLIRRDGRDLGVVEWSSCKRHGLGDLKDTSAASRPRP